MAETIAAILYGALMLSVVCIGGLVVLVIVGLRLTDPRYGGLRRG